MAVFRVGRRWVVGLVVFVLVSGMLGAYPVAAVDGPGGGGVVAVGGFDDVGGGVHEPAVEALEADGVFDGTECGDGLFCPGEPILRWVMAVWLVRVLGEEPAEAGSSRFADVDAGEWWAPYVEALADLGVTRGCDTDPLRFCPDESVTRAQMASFLVRAFALEVAGSAGFVDTAGGTHEENIDALAAGGVTAGCDTDPLRYCPDKAVTRAQMATFLARATGLVAIPATGSGSAGTPDVSEVVAVFDPLTTPTLSDLDLDRLAVAVATLDETVVCPPTVAPDSLDDVAEVVRIADGCMIVEYEPLRGRTVEEVREALSADLSVHAVGVPPRDIYPDQSPPTDSWRVEQWFLDAIGIEPLWDMWPSGPGSDDVIVAVIDDGVDATHPDLDANVLNIGNACHRVPNAGHGTHVAGIIAAERDNDGAVVGIAPDAKILPIKVHYSADKRVPGILDREYWGLELENVPLDADCHKDVPSLTAALTRAVNERADVINMSLRWSLEEDDARQDTAELAIRAAAMNGIVVVVSAGNCGSNDPENLEHNKCEMRHQRQRPAAYPGVIAVAATDEANLRADYSTSNRDVDIAAPGSGILSTWPEAEMLREVSDNFTLAENDRCGRSADSVGRTCWKSGTSMAAPVVSGVVAHMKAHHPGASVTQIQYALYSTADRTNDSGNPAYSNDYGHGFVNPSGAIKALGDIKRRRGDFEALSAGAGHTCGLATNGAVECWGRNDDGQSDRAAGTFTAVSSGGFHTCGIREAGRAVECWGRDDHKQTSTAPPAVTIVGGTAIGDYVTAVASGGYHSCAILVDDTVGMLGP